MAHKDDRDRLRQTSIERRRVKPAPPRVTRSRSARTKGVDPRNGAEANDTLLSDLRARAERAASLRLWPSAVFFAEKAATASQSSDDVLLLAQMHFSAGDPTRALRVVNANKLEQSSAPARLLAAQCLLARDRPADAAELLGESPTPFETCAPPELRAALCVARTHAFQALESPEKVELWARKALEADPHCAEALIVLTRSGLLSPDKAATVARETADAAEGTTRSGDARDAALPALYRALGDTTALDALPRSLTRSADVAALRAARHYDAFEYAACTRQCRTLIRGAASASRPVILLYLAALVELRARQELFIYAHDLVARDPADAAAWMAVGCYYLASSAPDTARAYLQKATVLDPRFVEAWIAVGHAYAAKDESEHAMTAYSTAARLCPGAYAPILFMGIQHARQSSLGLACRLFTAAADANAQDPAPKHELGVLAFRAGDLARAVEYFRATLSLWDRSGNGRRGVGRRAEAEEVSLVNLAHCYRRLGRFDQAHHCYKQALTLQPNKPSTFTALALNMHCQQRYDEAITMYHRALRFRPEDVICNELLERALEDNIEFNNPVDIDKDNLDGIVLLNEKDVED